MVFQDVLVASFLKCVPSTKKKKLLLIEKRFRKRFRILSVSKKNLTIHTKILWFVLCYFSTLKSSWSTWPRFDLNSQQTRGVWQTASFTRSLHKIRQAAFQWSFSKMKSTRAASRASPTESSVRPWPSRFLQQPLRAAEGIREAGMLFRLAAFRLCQRQKHKEIRRKEGECTSTLYLEHTRAWGN